VSFFSISLSKKSKSKSKSTNTFLFFRPSPSIREDKITDNETARTWITRYLSIGEMVMDQSVAVMSSSGWFERTR
jgi:hypothetical protein